MRCRQQCVRTHNRNWILAPYRNECSSNKKVKQVAQLSQRDRTAGRVSYGQKWKTETGRHYFTDIIFHHCDVLDQQSRIRRKKRKIKAITPFKVIQGHQARYQSKARMRLPISDLTVTDISSRIISAYRSLFCKILDTAF